jgi:hypothetical protein
MLIGFPIMERNKTMRFVLIDGDPMEPSALDKIAQFDSLEVGLRVPDGWRVLSGNSRESEVCRIVYRFELESNNG